MNQHRTHGLAAAAKGTGALFFALMPDADAASRIVGLTRRLRGDAGFKGEPIDADRLHVSLHGIGAYAAMPHGVVAAAREAAATIAEPSFDVVFDRVVSFRGRPGKRPLVLAAGGELVALAAFRQKLGMAMAKARLGRSARIEPHVTLLYGDQGDCEQAVQSIGWTVRAFALVYSLWGKSRYVVLDRWR